VVSKTQLLLPSILPLRFATLGSRIVTCRKSEGNRKKRKSPNKHESSSKKKRTYDKARIAFEALALLAQGNPTSPSSSSNCTEDSNQDSNFSGTTNSSSSSKLSTQSYKTAEYDTDKFPS